jgi:poly(hydroxyalkanoate) depolymerase family esterase
MSLRTSVQDTLKLTHSQRLMEATRRIQATLTGRTQAANEPKSSVSFKSGKSVRPLGQVVQALQKLKQSSFPFGKVGKGPSATEPEIAEGAKFHARFFSCKAGSRSYKLYIPHHKPDAQRPLLIMLHGCKQNPLDFAVGTRMNALAEIHGIVVAYPAQTQSDNPSACWNWFNPIHQSHGKGEPAIIAGLTEEIMKSYDIDEKKVFVAGLSAGGAMAAVMGETYPRLFSAVGVHSGLPYRSASDVVSAFAAMRGDATHTNTAPKIRTIVFHGDADSIVAPSNGANILSEADFSPLHSQVTKEYTKRIARDARGLPLFEHWLLHGGGHAWSGGNSEGSYTDPSGPDASAEMIRFFLGYRHTQSESSPGKFVA